jgi:HAD superfamily hydrolase (TIGR01509 family)
MSAIIFDLDGVLLDSEGSQYQAYAQVLRTFGVTITLEEYAQHWIAAGHGSEYAVRTYDLPVDEPGLKALKHPVYHEILRQHAALMPGAFDVLARLHSRFPLGLATNSIRTDVSFVVDRFGLRPFFASIITREDYALPKPDPGAFLAAAAGLKVPPQACLVVEDAYKGILAAHRAGAVPVAVPNVYTRGNNFSLAATVLDSLEDLTVTLVETLLAGRHGR